MTDLPYTREELKTADPGFPDRGPICSRCRTHVPQFADLAPKDEAVILSLLDRNEPVQAMHALENATGCPLRWAKIWVLHRGEPAIPYYCDICKTKFLERSPRSTETNQDVACPKCHHVETRPA